MPTPTTWVSGSPLMAPQATGPGQKLMVAGGRTNTKHSRAPGTRTPTVTSLAHGKKTQLASLAPGHQNQLLPTTSMAKATTSVCGLLQMAPRAAGPGQRLKEADGPEKTQALAPGSMTAPMSLLDPGLTTTAMQQDLGSPQKTNQTSKLPRLVRLAPG